MIRMLHISRAIGLLVALCAAPCPAQHLVRSTSDTPGVVTSAVSPSGWSHSGRGASRVSAIELADEPGPPPLGGGWPTVQINQLPDGTPIEFMSRTSPVLHGSTAFALAWIDGYEHLVAVDLPTGLAKWTSPLPELVTDSWSSPTVDPQHRTVLVAMGEEVIALSTRTGRERWRTTLMGPVVNASPLVTSDLGPRDRAFITDYGYFSDAGRLYCVNIDRYDAALNPYHPGEIVWAVPIDAVTSGNSPAYENGTVYVATPGDGFVGGGRVLAFDATSTAPPAPLWAFENVINAGFFGGVSVRDGSVYAASYSFSGTQLNSNLVRLNAKTGTLQWSSPSNRTSSIPVPLSDGRVVLSGGIMPDPVFGDYGSRPSIATYSPGGILMLETALQTWSDTDRDGTIDPGEALLVGGWTHQPVVIEHQSGHAEVICGVAASGTDPTIGEAGLVRLNLDWTPTNPAPLILQSSLLGGGSPAAANGRLLSIGPGGLTVWLNRADRTSP